MRFLRGLGGDGVFVPPKHLPSLPAGLYYLLVGFTDYFSYLVPPIAFCGKVIRQVEVRERVFEHYGDETEPIIRYIVPTLDGQNRPPVGVGRDGIPTYTISSNANLGIAVPRKGSPYRTTAFKITAAGVLRIYHSSQISENKFNKTPEDQKKRIE